MSLYGGELKSLYLTFSSLYFDHTRYGQRACIKYAVFLKNSIGSEGELIGVVDSSSNTDNMSTVAYMLSKNY